MPKNTPQNTSKDVEMTEITNIKTWQKRLFNGDGTLKPDENNVYEAFNSFMLNGFMNAKHTTDDLEYFLEHFKFEVLIKIADENFAKFYIIKVYKLLNKDTKEILRLFGGESQVQNNPTNQENEQLRIDLLNMINESIENNSDGASVNAEQTMGSNEMSDNSNSNDDDNSVNTFYTNLDNNSESDSISVSGGSSVDPDDNSNHSLQSLHSGQPHHSSKFSVTGSSFSSEQIGKSGSSDTEYTEDFENNSVISDVSTDDEVKSSEIEELEKAYNLNKLVTAPSNEFLDKFWEFVTKNIHDLAFASKFLELHNLAKLKEYLDVDDAVYLYFIANMTSILDSYVEGLTARKQTLQNISQNNLSPIEKTIINSLINIVDGLLKSQPIFNILDTLINSSQEFANFFTLKKIAKFLEQNPVMEVIQLNLNAHNQYPTDESRQLINDNLNYLCKLSDDTLAQTIIKTKCQLISSLKAAISAYDSSNLKDDANDDESTIHTEYSQNDNSSVGTGQNSGVFAQNTTYVGVNSSTVLNTVVSSHSSTHHSSSQLNANSTRSAGGQFNFNSNLPVVPNTPEETSAIILAKLCDFKSSLGAISANPNLSDEQGTSLNTLLNELMTLSQIPPEHPKEGYRNNITEALSILTNLGSVTVSGLNIESLSQSLDARIQELKNIVNPQSQQVNSSNVGTPNTRSRLNSFSSTNSQDSSLSESNSLGSQNYIPFSSNSNQVQGGGNLRVPPPPPPPPPTYDAEKARLNNLTSSFDFTASNLSDDHAKRLNSILKNLQSLSNQTGGSTTIPENTINNISSSLKSLGTVTLADGNDATLLNSLIKKNISTLEQLIPSNQNSNSIANSGGFSDPNAPYNLYSFFNRDESITQEITLYASTTQIPGDPDLNPVNVSKTDNVTISTIPISVYAPSSGQEYSFSLKEKVISNASSGGGGAPYDSDELTSKTYHHASLKISSITDDNQNQKLALTIMNMIENIVSSSQNLKIRTTNPLAAAIADVYYNDYLIHSGVDCLKYKNPKFNELGDEDKANIKAQAEGILNTLIPNKDEFKNALASCPWYQAALQVRSELTNTNRLSRGHS